MVVHQRKAFGPESPSQLLADHSLKRRSLEIPLSTQTIHDFGVRGRRPTVTFLGKVQNSGPPFDNNSSIEIKDFAWFFLRLNKHHSLFSASDAEKG